MTPQGSGPVGVTTCDHPRLGARWSLVPGPCVREERPTDISQCCEAGRMKLGYLRVCASQRRSRRKTLHFNLLRNPRPTTTLAGRVVLPVFTGVAEFERPLIAIRTEEGRRTARAPDVPFDRRPKLRPDQRSLSLANLLKSRDNTAEKSPRPSTSMSQRSFAASAQRRPYDSTPFLSHARSVVDPGHAHARGSTTHVWSRRAMAHQGALLQSLAAS